MKNLTVFLFLSLILFSCNKNKEEENPVIADHPLFGYWVSQEMEEDVFVMDKSEGFLTDRYGFAFYPDGGFGENKNSGECGTPPIHYRVFNGTWHYVSGNFYEIHVGYWGGTITYRIELIYLDSETLKFRYHYNF